jgi:hypothetical protein
VAAKRGKRAAAVTLDAAMAAPAASKLAGLPEQEVTRLSEDLREEREERPRSIEDVVARHIPPEGPSPDHGHRTIPPEERPDRRDGATLGPVTVYDDPEIPDESDERIRSLEDLMARFPFTGPTGDYFVRVVRVAPKSYHGMLCTGVLRRIVTTLNQAQFTEAYGGGEYELTVYGPPNGPGMYDPHTGKPQPKAKTRPIRFTVPYDRDGIFGIPPNPAASIPEADAAYPMENPMQPVNPTQPTTPTTRFINPHVVTGMRISTPSDAEIHKTDLGFETKMIEREDSREEQERKRLEARALADQQIELERMKSQERRELSAIEMAREQAQSEREQRMDAQRALLERDSKKDPAAVDLPALISAVRGDGSDLRLELSRVTETHRAELLRLTETHKADLERINEASRREIERERSLCEEKLRLGRDETSRERERLDRSTKDVEERAASRVRDAEDRLERRLVEVRADYERQLTAQERMWEGRLNDERRNGEREVASRRESHEANIQTSRVTFEVQLKAAEQELARLRTENDRLRSDLAASGDVVAQVEKVTKVANALGFTKAAEVSDEEAGGDKPPSDWRSLVSVLGADVIKNLPEIMRSAGDAVSALRARREAAAAAPPAQPAVYDDGMAALPTAAPRGRFQARQRITFAGEDEPWAVPVPGTPMIATPPIYDHGMELAPPGPPPVSMPVAAPPPTMVHPAPPAPVSVPPPRPTVRPAAPPAPPAPPEDAEVAAAITREVLKFRLPLEQTYKEGTPIGEFVGGLVAAVGEDTVRQYAQLLSADRVISVLEAQPDGAASPLLQFKGKRWLREFEAAARAI